MYLHQLRRRSATWLSFDPSLQTLPLDGLYMPRHQTSTEIGALWKDSLPRAIDGIISGALKITLQERELNAGLKAVPFEDA